MAANKWDAELNTSSVTCGEPSRDNGIVVVSLLLLRCFLFVMS